MTLVVHPTLQAGRSTCCALSGSDAATIDMRRRGSVGSVPYSVEGSGAATITTGRPQDGAVTLAQQDGHTTVFAKHWLPRSRVLADARCYRRMETT